MDTVGPLPVLCESFPTSHPNILDTSNEIIPYSLVDMAEMIG